MVPDISIVIVNYKTPSLTDICIGSIYQFTEGIDFEIVLVDNDSQDESKSLITTKYPKVKWVDSGSNAGTSVAYNIGVKNSIGKYILILNSDTEFRENTIKKCLDIYIAKEKSEKIGLLGCQLVGYDSIIQFNSNIKFPAIKDFLRGNSLFIKLGLYQDKITKNERLVLHQKDHKSEWLGIVFGIVNADVFRKENAYFDEDIFMYSDEVDWCFRLKQMGYNHYFTTCSTLLHWNGGSSTNFSEWRYGQIIISNWLCIMKIYGKFYYLMCMIIFWINFFTDESFYWKNKIVSSISDIDNEQRFYRILDAKIFSRYFFTILFTYKKTLSSRGSFLKYQIN